MPAGQRPDPPRLPLADPMLARRALSDMRSVVRHGFAFVRDGIDQAPLPTPVAAIAGSVLRRVDGLAHHADAVARSVVDGLLGPVATGEATSFADTLRRAAEGLGPAPLQVNDGAVRRALGAADTASPEAAALLMCWLIEAGAVVPAGREASVAIFAAVLARLQKSRDPASHGACRAIAEAVADEIGAAGADTGPLARLFAEFRDRV